MSFKRFQKKRLGLKLRLESPTTTTDLTQIYLDFIRELKNNFVNFIIQSKDYYRIL